MRCGTCNTVETDCKAWAAHPLPGGPVGRCYKCGEDVCVLCSKRVIYLRFGRRRICGRCIAEMAHFARMAEKRKANRV